jgi:hypothetical protein
MKLYKLAFLLILVSVLLTSTIVAKAAIYQATRSFENSDEILYSNWVKDTVAQDIFSNPESPYFGIKTDCADAAFALRAIYAFENKLSFEFIENEGRKITEKTTRFDNISSTEIGKLKAFIEFIAYSVGSEVLASDNTYPIDLKAIRPGDLYITRWSNPLGELTRHVYIVKNILPTGDLLLYSSTQPRAVRPFLPRKGMPLKIFKDKPFGFRRFQANLGQSKEKQESFSNMQYEALKLGPEKFFALVKEGLKSSEDTLQLNIERRIENICVALETRKDVVEIALEERNPGKCFSKDRYDEFSTPSRDRNIINDIQRIKNGYTTVVKNEMTGELNNETRLGLDYLIGSDSSEEGLNALKNLCSIGIDLGGDRKIIMTIKSFSDRYSAGVVSANPNESLGARWGLERAKGTCKSL